MQKLRYWCLYHWCAAMALTIVASLTGCWSIAPAVECLVARTRVSHNAHLSICSSFIINLSNPAKCIKCAHFWPGAVSSGRNYSVSASNIYSLNLYWPAAVAAIACTFTAALLHQAKCVLNRLYFLVAVRRRQAHCHLWPCFKFCYCVSRLFLVLVGVTHLSEGAATCTEWTVYFENVAVVSSVVVVSGLYGTRFCLSGPGLGVYETWIWNSLFTVRNFSTCPRFWFKKNTLCFSWPMLDLRLKYLSMAQSKMLFSITLFMSVVICLLIWMILFWVVAKV